MSSSAPVLRSHWRELAVPMAVAPRYLASCTAKCPTPPAAAWIRTRWPVCNLRGVGEEPATRSKRPAERPPLHGQCLWLVCELARGRSDELGIGAGGTREPRHPVDLVADREGGRADAELFDDSRDIPTERERWCPEPPAIPPPARDFQSTGLIPRREPAPRPRSVRLRRGTRTTSRTSGDPDRS